MRQDLSYRDGAERLALQTVAMSSVHERLKKAREAAGYASAADFARAEGVGEATYRHHENGNRGLRLHQAERYARALRVDLGWLLTGEGEREGAEIPGGRTIPLASIDVLGAVQAGQWREALEWDRADWYQVAIPINPRYARFKQFGLEVRGDSMNEVYPHGSVVVCVKLMDLGQDPEPGQRVVCLRRSETGDLYEATVKELRRHSNGSYWLWPRSTNPEFQQPWRLPPAADHDFDNEDIRVLALVVGTFKFEA